MHHPGFNKTENYGSSKAATGAHASDYGPSSDVGTRAGTGTWNGPAPTGARNPEAAAAAAAKPAVVYEATTALLSTGQRMPMIGLGTFQLSSAAVVRKALELGYRHFDCAAFYGNEAIVGEGLAEFIAAGRRSELFVTGKVWNTHHKPADARASVQQSLKDLGLQQLDLVLVHWPEAWAAGSDPKGTVTPDDSVSLLDTWRGLEALVDEGLVSSLGLSNCSLAQVEEVLAAAKHKPVCNQVELHPLLAQRKLVGVSYRKGVVSVAHTPWAGARRSCWSTPWWRRLRQRRARLLSRASVALFPTQVLLKYNMQRGVVVIPKASSPEHLAANLQDMFSWRLNNKQKVLLDTMDTGRRFVDFPWKNWGDTEEGGVAKPSIVLAAGKGTA
ncbi:NADP-dependent oxidoreductase domain-containing protein [Scenedesmus sp. NREL 46B-D3]|nr:NADP-dependent oxidoreductase domain-containing protein [Scenedesmus sp. NREL 46B-D3]